MAASSIATVGCSSRKYIVRYHAGRSHSIYETATWADKQFGLLSGSGLQIVKRLLWEKVIPWSPEKTGRNER